MFHLLFRLWYISQKLDCDASTLLIPRIDIYQSQSDWFSLQSRLWIGTGINKLLLFPEWSNLEASYVIFYDSAFLSFLWYFVFWLKRIVLSHCLVISNCDSASTVFIIKHFLFCIQVMLPVLNLNFWNVFSDRAFYYKPQSLRKNIQKYAEYTVEIFTTFPLTVHVS